MGQDLSGRCRVHDDGVPARTAVVLRPNFKSNLSGDERFLHTRGGRCDEVEDLVDRADAVYAWHADRDLEVFVEDLLGLEGEMVEVRRRLAWFVARGPRVEEARGVAARFHVDQQRA
jgi:hypothetical protein